MKSYGLIGETLTYSFSENYFNKKFKEEGIENCEYKLYEIPKIEEFCSLIDSTEFSGLNVTIPYKESVIPYLDLLDEQAAEIGAVNTIHFDGTNTKGYNTDIVGFNQSVAELIGDSAVKRALVLGTGGASKAIQYVLKNRGILPTVVSRSKGDISYSEIDKEVMKEHLLVINCTPLGTHPNVDNCPDLPYDQVTEEHLFYDLVYNPEKTLFLKKGQESRAKIMNGLPMLIGQAEAAWKIWTNN